MGRSDIPFQPRDTTIPEIIPVHGLFKQMILVLILNEFNVPAQPS
jgi:hypothetical protein